MNNEQAARLRNVLDQASRAASDAIETWPLDAQEWMTVEECAELLLALARMQRGRMTSADVVEEAADALIMALQMGLMHGDNAFIDMLAMKASRLEARIRAQKVGES